jgi:DNA-binding transcriptional MerR regulator
MLLSSLVMSDFTIDQLAQRVGMSTRNIREWQRQGLVARPARRGRVGIYSDAHVTRIERVKKLHAQGLPLDLIRRLSDSGTAPELDIRHLADEVLDPLSVAGASTLPRSALVARVGQEAFESLEHMGFLEVAAEQDHPDDRADDDVPVRVRDATMLDLIEQLSRIGISSARLASALVEVQRHQLDIARRVVDLYRDEVWAPFVAAGFTGRDWGSIADDMAKAKPMAIMLLARMLDAALDDAVAPVLVHAASEAAHALEAPEAPVPDDR